jgi:hypothetical protein
VGVLGSIKFKEFLKILQKTFHEAKYCVEPQCPMMQAVRASETSVNFYKNI